MLEELKQKARKYNEINVNEILSDGNVFVSTEKAYIAGVTENGIQWHDLRKDPKDLPKDRCEYLVCFRGESHYGVGFVAENGLRFICYGGEYDDVIAWCEIPQFKE